MGGINDRPGMTDTPAAQPQAPRSVGVRREPFVFSGTASEYFGMWIVNVLLTVVTLGIYSAWAKVRRRRYFYGNTFLAGASFDYHAHPVRILIGRIIVLSMLIIYNVTLQFLPLIGGIIGVVFLFAIPWFLMRGLRFNARVTSYRNVRFDFSGTYWGAFQAYVLGGALIYGTAGILAPLASQWMWNYSLGHLKYGDRPVSCDPRLERLYTQWWLPAFVLVGGVAMLITIAVVLALAFSGNVMGFLGSDPKQWSPYLIMAAIYLAFIPFAILYMICGLLYTAGIRNVAFSETVIDGRHALYSSVGRWRFVWISVSNLVATILTLGLARPWAAIRRARYMASVTALDATTPLDAYFSTIKGEGAAVGSEYLDVEGIDIGF